jgi:hypothetical protein
MRGLVKNKRKHMVIWFGKFKGTPIEDLPDDYLGWLASLENLHDKLRPVVDAEWERRIFLREHPGCINPRLVDEIVGAGLRSLARKYHPDHGGSDEKMQLINVCGDWLKERAREVLP